MSRKKSALEQPSGLPPAQTAAEFAAEQAAAQEHAEPMPSAPDVPGIDTTPPLEPLHPAGVEYAPGTHPDVHSNGQPDQAAAVRQKKISACLTWLDGQYDATIWDRFGQRIVFVGAKDRPGSFPHLVMLNFSETDLVRSYSKAVEWMGLNCSTLDEAFAATMPKKGSAE